jgi:poly(beta-D-mannuronate) lyase
VSFRWARFEQLVRIATLSVGLLAGLPAGSAQSCPRVPAPIVSLNVPRYYSDAEGTIVDPKLHAVHEAAVEPLTDFLREVVSNADHGWTRSSAKGQAEAAECALLWLGTWARAGAWLGTMSTKQAEYQRKWDLAGVAMSYLKVRRFASPEMQQVIDPWLMQFADLARAFFDDPEHKRNNHWYWLGLGVGAVGLATGSDKHWQMARGIMQDAAKDVAPDGTLAAEMVRGPRALFYHAFSVMPLVLMAELGAAKGEDWYSLENGALHRLVATTTTGLVSPEIFDARAGVAQERPVNTRAGWLQAYQLRFPDKLTEPLPKVADSHRWIGGKVAVLLQALSR